MREDAHERSGEAEIATSTLAEIYLQQGLVDRALVIYRRLAQRSPDDARLAGRVAELETELERQNALKEGPLPAPEPVFSPSAGSAASPPSPAPEPTVELPPRAGAPPVDQDHEFLAWLEKR